MSKNIYEILIVKFRYTALSPYYTSIACLPVFGIFWYLFDVYAFFLWTIDIDRRYIIPLTHYLRTSILIGRSRKISILTRRFLIDIAHP